jgi:hypothetical protein
MYSANEIKYSEHERKRTAMKQLYKYRGTVSSIGFDSKGCGTADIILGDLSDWDKPPVRVTAHGALAKYVYEIGMTDAEERYISSDWYYDRNLFLHRVEVPSNNGRAPAKIIMNAKFLSDELAVFGPKEYIETDSPVPMDDEQCSAWYEFRLNQ